MKNTINAERKLSLRTHTIRDLTAEDLRLAVGGRGSGSGSGGGHGFGSGSDRSGSQAGSYGSGSAAPSA